VRKEDFDPTYRFAASLEVGSRTTINTQQTVYPHVPASSLVKGQSVHPRAATCHAAPYPASLQGRALVQPHILQLRIMNPNSGGLRLPRVPWLRIPPTC
jgi:hypothetical protein